MLLEDENTVDCYLWELKSGFAEGFTDEYIREQAERVELQAIAERHEICYLVPDLGIGGSISSGIHIIDGLALLSEKHGVTFTTVTSETFAAKYNIIMDFSLTDGNLATDRILH